MKTKITQFLVVGALCASFPAFTQNLVPNAGFETQDACPAPDEIFLAPPWNSASMATPDLFNTTCASQNLPGRTGIGSSGVYAYTTFANNREYIQAELNSPLQAGQGYCVSFYVKRLNYRYAVNRMGAYFSNGEISQGNTSYINVTPQVENDPGNMLSSSSTWTQISGSFTAVGGESHLVIGNFSTDADTDTLVANAAHASKVAYYMIDDISVTACVAGMNELDAAALEINLFPVPASTHVNVSNTSDQTIVSYSLMDLTGKQVGSNEVMGSSGNDFSIDVSSILEGMYLVLIQTNVGVINKRIIVKK